MQRISIENNGPVKKFEMEINKFNILIGEQATGKSTIAKSVYFFHLIKTTIIDYLWQISDRNSYRFKSVENTRFDRVIKKDLKSIFIDLFGYSWNLDGRLKMKYEYSQDIWIAVDLAESGAPGKKFIGVTYSPKLMTEIRQIEKKAAEIYKSSQAMQISLALASEERQRNHNLILEKVNAIFDDDLEVYYIPAGRSLLTVMSNNRAILSGAKNLDLITDKFLLIIDSIREKFADGVKMVHKYYPDGNRKFDVEAVANQLISILKGEYFYLRGEEVLKIEGSSNPVKINFSSSGQQEVLWLINFLYVLMLKKEKAFVIIEEPEAHIYPALQKRMMEFIALFANLNQSAVFLTTHSPYILSVANNLYYAGNLKNRGMGDAVRKFVNEKNLIDAGKLSAYKLNMDQNHENLMDEECKEIKAHLIDEISDEVNELYTALYGIELDYE